MNTITKNGQANTTVRDMTRVAVFAALIYASILIRVQVGEQMVHFGNAMVLVGALIFGSKRGAVAASIGLFLFDATHGYLFVAWITVLESLIVCLMVYLLFELLLKKKDNTATIIGIAVSAAVLKVIMNLVKYTFFYGMIGGGLSLDAAFGGAIIKITGSYGSAILTVITVPILYPIFKRIVNTL